jgi:hypothetical protein
MITLSEGQQILDGIDGMRRAIDSLRLNLIIELDVQRSRVNKLLRELDPSQAGSQIRVHL